MNIARLCIVAALLAGCATPVGQIPAEDFAWEITELPIGYQAAYRNLRNGFDRCGGRTAKGDIFTDIREGRMAVYSGNTDLVTGVIYVSELTAQTSRLKIGVQHQYDKPVFGVPGRIRARWRDWAGGGTACPGD